MIKYDRVDALLDQQLPGWRDDYFDKWLIDRAKSEWNDRHSIEEDGSQAHLDYIVTYMAKVTTLPPEKINQIARVASGGVHRPSRRLDKIRARHAEKPDEYVGAGDTMRLITPAEKAEIEQRNRSRHRFMSPEEYRRQQAEAASRVGRMSRLRDPNEPDEHQGLVSHSIPVSGAVGDTRTRR